MDRAFAEETYVRWGVCGGAQDFGYEVNAPLPPEAKKILKI